MWRLIFALNLVLAAEAVAGERRAAFQVGITITGKPGSVATTQTAMPVVTPGVPLPRPRPATLGRRDAAVYSR